ncbi:MAG TPA: dihydroorotate dehydrogenase [Candidatus Limnocylindrales bacterium]|nr:dihydroorotate dehydrogenase [Candidatus Limnocylindrales bacterium]
MNSNVDLRVGVGSVELATPVIAASGTFGYGVEYDHLLDWSLVGGVSVKGLSAEPSEGHAAPRMVETPGGMLNAIGLQNIGADAFVRDKLPRLRQLGPRIIANCWGNTTTDFERVVEKLDAAEVDAIEVNLSCPHKHEWGGVLAADPRMTAEVVRAVRQRTRRPLWIKLSPNVADITEIAKVAEAEGADAVTLINTLRGLSIDIETRRPSLANGSGGLSGPAIKPVALYMVHATAKAVRIPVVGVGGIMTGRDAVEFLMAGAAAVEVGTASLYDPGAPARIAAELAECLRTIGATDAAAVIATLRT